jgi:hypothetical protein
MLNVGKEIAALKRLTVPGLGYRASEGGPARAWRRSPPRRPSRRRPASGAPYNDPPRACGGLRPAATPHARASRHDGDGVRERVHFTVCASHTSHREYRVLLMQMSIGASGAGKGRPRGRSTSRHQACCGVRPAVFALRSERSSIVPGPPVDRGCRGAYPDRMMLGAAWIGSD